MYEAFMNNKFTNVLIMLIMFMGFCLISPFFFIWKFTYTILRRQPIENMSGKVVLITGASSGIGEWMAYEYAKKRACLVLVARRESQLQQVAQKSRTLGSSEVLVVCADVSNFDDCKRFVDQTIAHFGRLDHLVDNAGIYRVYQLNMDVTEFEPVMDINFWGSIYPTYFAIPHLEKSNGKIVVNASAAAFMHPPKSAFYAASKAALVGFFESLRYELPPTITVTIVTLGNIETDILKGSTKEHPDQLHSDVGKAYPVMSVEPCAKAIVEGACRGEKYITEPKFFKVFFLLKSLCPELFEWWMGKSIHSNLSFYDKDGPSNLAEVPPLQTKAD